MSGIEKILEDVSAAMHDGQFGKAEQTLQASLLNCKEESEIDLLLQGLMHLFSHTQNLNIEKAQGYMDIRELRQPMAHIALSQAYFQLHIRSDLHAARDWADKAIARSQTEEDWCTLYSACAVCGLIAANTDDRKAVLFALNEIEKIIGKDEYISYGDAVIFLEVAVKSRGEAGTKAKQLAGRIASLIDDEDFQTRAKALTLVA